MGQHQVSQQFFSLCRSTPIAIFFCRIILRAIKLSKICRLNLHRRLNLNKNYD